jgi:octaprenyl-diphosphate synthase
MFVADSNAARAAAASPPHPDPNNPWKQIVEPVEPFLEAVDRELAGQVAAFDPALAEYAEYALTAGGKHLRPALVALSANALGGSRPAHVTVATIIEMVHLATLVHDDVMDEAQVRRGRLTLAAQWGNEIAVLFGDCLFAQALRLAASFPTPEVCRAVAGATNTVCAGEILQTRNRFHFELPAADYFRVIEMKTAELFGLSCELAALLAEAMPEQRAALRQFGMRFGVAYQIYDDCLDLFGVESVAGKSLGTDLIKGKMTLPLLHLRDRLNGAEQEKLRASLADWQVEALPEVRRLLHAQDVLTPCRAAIAEQLEAARRALDGVPGPGRKALWQLTDYLARQVDSLGGAN